LHAPPPPLVLELLLDELLLDELLLDELPLDELLLDELPLDELLLELEPLLELELLLELLDPPGHLAWPQSAGTALGVQSGWLVWPWRHT
jgi:hypothetical protein